MVEIRHILCPVDFSDGSRHALHYAVALARWYGASVQAAYVMPTATELAVVEMGRLSSTTPPMEPLEEFVAPCRHREVALTAGYLFGAPWRQIVQAGASADLIVMGTHGQGGFEHALLGSVTEKVLRKATRPVLAVPRSAKPPEPSGAPFGVILVPVDYSRASEAALRVALSLARDADARLVMLDVLPEKSGEADEEADRARLREALPPDARQWCQPETMIRSGMPWAQILGVADEIAAEVVVMGITGRHAIDRALFGSTTHRVLQMARCPVLGVPSAD